MNPLCYCTNVHPAEDLAGVVRQLDEFALPVRERFGEPVLGLGLWLAADVAHGLAGNPAWLARLKHELAVRGLEVRTLNAFPQRGFHDDVVKHRVYSPNWTEPSRLDYTRACAEVLHGLLPDDAEGSISTLPLGWREPWTARDDAAARKALTSALRRDRSIRLAVEPEPGCVLDTAADAVGWLRDLGDDLVGLCLDACHLAVGFADPASTFALAEAAGVPVVKIQASAALHVPDPRAEDARRALRAFGEPRYLHQVREGTTHRADDLDEALERLPGDEPWRVHFHVPLHAELQRPLRSTTDVLEQVLAAAPAGPVVEVETYTWNVLPGPPQDLVTGIAAELDWVRRRLR
ncbi:metabolite traffic protein EboE [Lentzea sp. NPDC060358]|uniref:metabolite traffic protein EboE n=1 Tax=Lentzea sp. NPDC060358 TaxID=3347103 RepID=UPI00364A18B4